MTYSDKTIVCRDCEKDFVFTAGEQEFYALRQLSNEPKRCPNCRMASRIKRDGGDPDRQITETPCHECGTLTLVPFRPTGAKPVYCSSCFRKQKMQK